MEYNNFLSRKEKEIGQKSYIKYTFINGLSYSFLAETIIYLMALNFGASNMQLGYISSAVYLTGIVVFFVPILFPNTRIIKLFFIAWLLRGGITIFYGLTPFLPNRISVYVIIVVYTLYCLFRNIAYPLNHVIQSCITKPTNRGDYTSLIIIILYSSMMLSRFISFSALTFFKSNELLGILSLLLLGFILNTFASFAIIKVPIRESIPKRSLREAFFTFRLYLKQKQTFLIILLYCGGMSLFVLFNFSIPFLKKEVNINSNIIFIYTMINFLGVIFASRTARPFLDRFGSKPLLIPVNLIIIIISIVWSISKPTTNPILFFVLGIISMYFIGMIRLLLDRLIINSIPEGDRIGFTSSLAVVFSFISLIIGILGGFLADLPTVLSLELNNEYSLSFLLMAFLATFNFIISFFIGEKGCLTAFEFLLTLISPKNRKTIHNLDKLNRTSDKVKKQLILVELESDDTMLATEEIQKRLKLSNLKDKEMVIRSLFSYPRYELLDEIIEEAQDKLSWWRQSAIFALGAYDDERSKTVLRKIFKEKYPYVKSIAAKSLARVNDFSFHREIIDMLKLKNLDVRTYINLIIAISLIENNGNYWSSIFLLIKEKASFRFQQTLINIGCTRLNFTPPIDEFFYDLNIDIESGFNTILEELYDIKVTDKELAELHCYLSEKNYYKIWSWSSKRCREFKLLEPFEPLRLEIIHFRKRDISPTMAIASLYFTIQLENQHRIQQSEHHISGRRDF
ncbi:MFS transporter [Thiospirochaeta perfilievii]|uniref:MFS transporter n=1 Tax=Thiospirochaeta perfilievii TaxID=252967 RepID=A0A5C1Q934_9SPIO|nr:MFS transporter [Thiospirochaeta perfilievii]QEN03878.1 MFS transporter [Thiospirochaeta perfilievii]